LAPNERVWYKTKLVAMATSFEILKKISDLSSKPQTLSYSIKIAKIAHGLCFAYDTKSVAMATSLEESEKLDQVRKIHANTFHLVLKIVKIGPVDTEMALLIVKKEETRNAWQSLAYSPLGAIVSPPSEYLRKTLTY